MTDFKKPFHLLEALLPLVALVALLALNAVTFGVDVLDGASQVALLCASMLAVALAIRKGHRWEHLEQGMYQTIASALPAIVFLFLIGALAGTWLLSGIIPAMLYYGLKILHPSFFLPAACLICAVITLATGSSWATIATVGVALLGVGKTLGFSEAMIAGAIISGAYFGDKVSPISETTTLAAAVTNTPLFTHIRYMFITSIPSFILTLLLFLLLGGIYRPTGTLVNNIQAISDSIAATFYISPLLLLVPVLITFIILRQVPMFPVLFIGTLTGSLVALCCQSHVFPMLAGKATCSGYDLYQISLQTIYGKTALATGSPLLDQLFTTSGMQGMLPTVWLILMSMIFGGVMETTGMLQVLMDQVVGNQQKPGALVTATTATCVFFNMATGDQSLSILLPGRMFKTLYKKASLAPENLSRALEDAATVTSPLIPWNSCGAVQATVLGVATLHYLPYCFFNWLSPLMGILVAYNGFRMKKTTANSDAQQ